MFGQARFGRRKSAFDESPDAMALSDFSMGVVAGIEMCLGIGERNEQSPRGVETERPQQNAAIAPASNSVQLTLPAL